MENNLRRKIWLLILIIVLAVGLSSAGFFFFVHDESGSLTVSELKSQVESFDRQLKVEGRVAPGSVDWDDKAQVIRFALTDDRESLSVVYEGIVPDNFKPGADLEVQGRYRPDGVFEALGFGQPNTFCSFCH